MTLAFTPKIVTANDLLEGDVVYLTDAGTWSRDHHDAELLLDDDTSALRLAAAECRIDEVVGVYLADAEAGPDGPEPVHFREAFRSRGPSNYLHGKQVA